LNKANEDPSAGVAKQQSHGLPPFKTVDSGVTVPKQILKVTKEAIYTSDADEPFVPVALKWNEDGKGLPDEGMFSSSCSSSYSPDHTSFSCVSSSACSVD
jgi:hypothetical protein